MVDESNCSNLVKHQVKPQVRHSLLKCFANLFENTQIKAFLGALPKYGDNRVTPLAYWMVGWMKKILFYFTLTSLSGSSSDKAQNLEKAKEAIRDFQSRVYFLKPINDGLHGTWVKRNDFHFVLAAVFFSLKNTCFDRFVIDYSGIFFSPQLLPWRLKFDLGA